jgi:hypothetical protein
VLHALALPGDVMTVRRLTPLSPAWPGDGGHTEAVAGARALATIGSDVALMRLYGISQRAKFRGSRLDDKPGRQPFTALGTVAASEVVRDLTIIAEPAAPGG